MACNALSQKNTMCDVAKSTTELGRIDIELSMTSRLVGGTANCGLGLGVAYNTFSLADTACDKAMSTAKLVISDVESVVTVG